MGLLGLLLGEEPSSSSTVYDSLSLLGDWTGVYPRPGELPGVLERPWGGELGVDGRRKGEGRGEPNDNGDGLKGALEVTWRYGGERSAEGDRKSTYHVGLTMGEMNKAMTHNCTVFPTRLGRSTHTYSEEGSRGERWQDR